MVIKFIFCINLGKELLSKKTIIKLHFNDLYHLLILNNNNSFISTMNLIYILKHFILTLNKILISESVNIEINPTIYIICLTFLKFVTVYIVLLKI
jgi:hypothetical protein